MTALILSPAGFASIIAAFTAGALGALVLRRHDRPADLWGNLWAIAGSILGLLFSGTALITGDVPAFGIATSFPLLSLSFRIDALSAFFLLLISLIALVSSVYALGYVRHYYGRYPLGALGFFTNAFIAGMILVVTAHHALWFLIVWEIMSLTSYFLVIYERREPENIRAGTLYFIMTHIGTAFIILAFLLMYGVTGSFDFSAIGRGMAAAPQLMRDAVFLFALIGFGAKAGIIPFHIWLPGAHPAAPSHVSALMSGVMIKTGIYMLVRVCMDFLPGPPPLWWGLLILGSGSVSSLLGVLYALSEHDLKRLLAYHSIENIGIILIGLGSALVFLSAGFTTLALLGLIAALFHTLNHATFKALLFLGAGAVIAQTHTRNIEEYGGLIRFMPQTALFFLAGSLAISALPPFNGFFSEWMTFQALFAGVATFSLLTKAIFLISVGSLAFTGGLAAACFVKAFGVTFLARPRSPEAGRAKEAPLPLRLAMAALALATLLLGVLSGGVSRGVASIAGTLPAFQGAAAMQPASYALLRVDTGFATVSLPALAAVLVAVAAAVAGGVHLFTRGRRVDLGRTWDCGADLTGRMEITATAFSRSIVTVFRGVLKPTGQTEIDYHDARLRYFPKSSTVRLEFGDVYAQFFYQPLQKMTLGIAEQIKKIQIGNINVYIGYILATLTFLLIMLAV
ncbi:MAG: hydrogenase 4 subunit B [Syntrophales bacterium]